MAYGGVTQDVVWRDPFCFCVRSSAYRGVPGFKTLIKPSYKALQRHQDKMREMIRQHRGAPQAALIHALNPVIQGWASYYSGVAAGWVTAPPTIT